MTKFKRNYSVFVVSIVVTLSTPQWTSAQTATKSSSKIPLHLLRVPLDKGVVAGNSYKNGSVGLELTPAPGLQLGTPEIKGTPGKVPLLVTVAAWGEQNGFSVSGGTVFYADDLSYYAENRRSTKAYVDRVARTQKDQGLELVGRAAEGQLGGVTFARADFSKPSGYEVVFVKACDVYAFVFIFAGPDLEGANKLIAQTNVKLDMKNSGCGRTSESAPLKK